MEHTHPDDKTYYRSAGSILDSVMKKMLEKRETKYTFVSDNWSYIIGPSMIRYAHFERLDRATLIIRVDNDSQKMIVLQQRKNILKRFCERYPEARIKYIKVIR